MKTLWRGIVVAVLIVTSVVGVASAASAQGEPYDTSSWSSASPSPAMAAAGIPDATVGWRFDAEAVVVVVPDAVNVDDATLRTIGEVIWATEPVRFRHLEVWHPTRMLHRRSYADLRRQFGERPAGLPEQPLKDLSFDGVGGTDVAFDWVRVFAAFCGVVAVMLVVVILVLVSAPWRRARTDAKL
jgi:hypothetical protein